MLTFLTVAIGYTIIWIAGMYFILYRIYMIGKRTERRMHEYDREYILPPHKKDWFFGIFLGVASYIISFLVIAVFIKP
jgi:hypothetical protein